MVIMFSSHTPTNMLHLDMLSPNFLPAPYPF
jgi:hypothetical protein